MIWRTLYYDSAYFYVYICLVLEYFFNRQEKRQGRKFVGNTRAK